MRYLSIALIAMSIIAADLVANSLRLPSSRGWDWSATFVLLWCAWAWRRTES